LKERNRGPQTGTVLIPLDHGDPAASQLAGHYEPPGTDNYLATVRIPQYIDHDACNPGQAWYRVTAVVGE